MPTPETIVSNFIVNGRATIVPLQKSFCSLQENRSDRLFRPRMIPVQRTVQRKTCNHDEIDNKIPVVGPVEHTDQKARRDDLRLKQNVF